MTVPLAGWYPDPSGAADFRWWDGTTWTDAVSASAEVAAPRNARPVGAAEEAAGASAASPTSPGHGSRDDQDPTAEPAGSPRSAARNEADPSRPPARKDRTVALLVAITLVISGGLVGLIGWRSYQSARQPAESTGSRAGTDPTGGSDPGTSSTRPGTPDDPRSGQLDEVTRRASIGPATMQLPPAPYELVSDPVTVPNVFDAMFVANAPVHPNYNGSDTWAATVGIGHIPADAWTDDDLPGFGRKALKAISEQFFGYTPTSVTKLDYHPVAVGSAACAELTADVHYAVKGLASTFDRVRIVGCPDGTDGSVVAAVSSVPDDAPERVSTLAERSLASFAVK